MTVTINEVGIDEAIGYYLEAQKSAVTKLVKSRVLTKDEAENAWVEKFAKPYVRINAVKEG